MNRFDYVKVLLYAYPKLGELAEAVGSGAEVKACLSFRSKMDAAALIETIAEEIVTSKKLYLLKRDLDKIVASCGMRQRYLLEYKYFRRKRVLKEQFGGFTLSVCERSYFRMQAALLSEMLEKFEAAGWTRARFFGEFSSFQPFMRILGALYEGKERAIVFKRRKKELALCQNSGNSCGAGEERLPRKTNRAITIRAAAATQMMTICVPESPSFGSSISPPPAPSSTSPDDA